MVMYTLGQHWEMGLRLPYRRCQFWQKKSFQMKLILILADMYASKIVHFGHRKPARIHWKANVPETSHCLMRILVQRHNWAIFRRKWARRRRYSQWRSLSGYVEQIFVHKNCRGWYRQHLFSTRRRSMFCAQKLNSSTLCLSLASISFKTLINSCNVEFPIERLYFHFSCFWIQKKKNKERKFMLNMPKNKKLLLVGYLWS